MTHASGISFTIEHGNKQRDLDLMFSDITPTGGLQFGQQLVEIIRKPNGPIRLSAWLNDATSFGRRLEASGIEFSLWGHQFSPIPVANYACYQRCALYVAESIIGVTTNGLDLFRNGHIAFLVDTMPAPARRPRPRHSREHLLVINMRLRPGRRHILQLRDVVPPNMEAVAEDDRATIEELINSTRQRVT